MWNLVSAGAATKKGGASDQARRRFQASRDECVRLRCEAPGNQEHVMHDPIDDTFDIADRAPAARRRFLQRCAALAAAATLSVPRAFAAADTIKIGYLTHRTGPFAPFAEADGFILDSANKVLAGGLTIGGKNYKVEIIARDDQSNPDRQSNLAAELINKEGIDLMLGQATIGPGIAQQCELNNIPCITTMTPWQAWMFPMKGDPAKGFNSVFHFFWGIDDIAKVYLDIWKDLGMPKLLGSAFENTLPGNAMGDPKLGMPAIFAQAGYKVIDIGKFAPGADDYSAYIQAFKKEGVEIVTGLFAPSEWASFVKQSAQMGFKPKVATIAKALLFRAACRRWAPRRMACPPRSGGRPPIRLRAASRVKAHASWPTPTRRPPRRNGRSRSG